MARRLTHIITTQVSHSRGEGARGRPGRFDRTYGSNYTELVRYLRDKYGIREKFITSILFDVFRYIEMEVLAGAGAFTVPRFGRFLAREVTHGCGEKGVSESNIVMRFTRKNLKPGHSFIDFEDEEWLDDE